MLFLKRKIFCLIPLQFFLLICSFQSFANKAVGNQSKAAATPTAFENLVPFILLGLVFYFLLIRPQSRKHRQLGDFLSKIKRGDEVLTSSGIYGRIEGLTDSFVILEVAEDVCIRIAKSQIASYAGNIENKKTKADQTK